MKILRAVEEDKPMSVLEMMLLSNFMQWIGTHEAQELNLCHESNQKCFAPIKWTCFLLKVDHLKASLLRPHNSETQYILVSHVP